MVNNPLKIGKGTIEEKIFAITEDYSSEQERMYGGKNDLISAQLLADHAGCTVEEVKQVMRGYGAIIKDNRICLNEAIQVERRKIADRPNFSSFVSNLRSSYFEKERIKEMEQQKSKSLTISIENFYGNNEFFEELKMPAKAYEIKDTLQRARVLDSTENYKQFIIFDCPLLPEIEHRYLDSPTIDELNFLAKRLGELNEEEQAVLKAVKGRFISEKEDELISVKDLINLTYELDNVSVILNVGNLTALGEFVIENDMQEDISAIPKSSLYLLDKAQIGKLQCENDGGVFANGNYFVTNDYKLKEIYDGKTLPETSKETDYIFRLEIAKCPEEDVSEVENGAEWICLPIGYEAADKIAKSHGGKRIEDCVYLDFESVVPQIRAENFGYMDKFTDLNKLAIAIQQMPDLEQAKFKAVLQAEEPQTIGEMLSILENLEKYEFAPQIDGASNYFKQYLSHYLDPHVDRAWLDTLLTREDGRDLMERLGVEETNYGLISSRGQSLYEYVARHGTPISLNEKFELIEVCGQTALFTNGRIRPEDVPKGLYRYDLREGEDGGFSNLENKVAVNHGGTILTKDEIQLGDEGCIEFTDETSPNFLGEEVSLREYLETDFTQTGTENNSIGDIKQ